MSGWLSQEGALALMLLGLMAAVLASGVVVLVQELDSEMPCGVVVEVRTAPERRWLEHGCALKHEVVPGLPVCMQPTVTERVVPSRSWAVLQDSTIMEVPRGVRGPVVGERWCRVSGLYGGRAIPLEDAQ